MVWVLLRRRLSLFGQRAEEETRVLDSVYFDTIRHDIVVAEDGYYSHPARSAVDPSIKNRFLRHVRSRIYQPEEGTALFEAEFTTRRLLSEIELELKEGPPETLLKMARELSGVIPVRLQTQSKPEIGYSLRDQEGRSAARRNDRRRLM